MTDSSLVAELLVRLGHSRAPPPPAALAWSVRQRRTKPTPRSPAEDKKKGGRSSPTTPLSWSGATSSGGGGGSDESPPLDSATRSKVSLASASAVSATIGGKRPRKKKTLAELREEESLLLKERRNLRHELATLRRDFEKERSINQSLKRIKQIGMQPPVIPEQHEQVQAPCVPSDCPEKGSGDGGAEVAMQPRFCNVSVVKKVESRERLELPDLNLPLEDGGGPDISCAAA
ncbi:uncharacterized protein J3R85_000679 [Psidium guajava]|nr:uncharacterized protein J3R85_000679 [Psidium guajava]